MLLLFCLLLVCLLLIVFGISPLNENLVSFSKKKKKVNRKRFQFDKFFKWFNHGFKNRTESRIVFFKILNSVRYFRCFTGFFWF